MEGIRCTHEGLGHTEQNKDDKNLGLQTGKLLLCPGGVRRAFLEDSGLGLFGCVGVHRLKELAGQREKCKQRQGDRRGLVGQRSEFSRPQSQERTRSLKEKSDLHTNPTPGPLHLLCPLPKVLFTQIFAQLLLLIVHLLRGFPGPQIPWLLTNHHQCAGLKQHAFV